ncbi:MAG: hypothetical protein ACRC7C_08980 [Beijerinckiaceae bacterium]
MPELYSGTLRWRISCSAAVFILGFACATPSVMAGDPDGYNGAHIGKACNAFDRRIRQVTAQHEEFALIPSDVAASIRRIADWVKLQRARDEPNEHLRRCTALLALFNHQDY